MPRREMITIGNFTQPDTEKEIKLVIYEKDRISKKLEAPPHFHVLYNNKTIACLRLDCAEYYDHGYKRDTELTQSVLNMIDMELRKSLNPTHFGNWSTIFDMAVGIWIHSNGKAYISNTLKQPDYTTVRRN